ncbi:MAG TPA: hypothetical protein VGI83_04690 [Gemmatimonadales bacterium]|jgi:hypothetical protein
MNDARHTLRHFAAALAYRTQKALRSASPSFAHFRAAPTVRTPHELVRHMTGVIGYARTFFHGGEWRPPDLPAFPDEVARFHEVLAGLADDIRTLTPTVSFEQLLQGPLSDAMTHAGQLAMLRRLAGDPVPPENFVFAAIDPENPTSEQPEPVSPDEGWHPAQPPGR